MKNILFFTLLSVTLSLAACKVGLRQRPPSSVVEVMPLPPSAVHVWVPGHYVYRRNSYVWNQGIYRAPPRGKTVWNQGRYNQNKRGYYRYKSGTWR